MVPTNTSWQAEAEDSLKDRRSKEVALKDLVASLAIIKELSDGSVTSGKITLRDKLFFFLLRYGEGFRSHDGELYAYEESGAWLNRKTCTVDMRPSLNLVEGILYKLSESITEEQLWNWEVVKAGLLDVLRNAANDGSSLLAFKQYCKKAAQSKWDSNLRETGGKKYNAHHFKKLAEIVSSLPEYFEIDFARGDHSQIWHGFTSRFNTPKPLSHGFCDGYRNDERQPAQPDPTNDCYFKLPFNYEAKSIRESDCPVILCRRLTVEEVRLVVIDFIDYVFLRQRRLLCDFLCLYILCVLWDPRCPYSVCTGRGGRWQRIV